MSKKKKNKKAGFVALIGRTNAGKSTFLNTILETKVSIVSDKPQTTRRRILGIKSTEKGQIVYFDSPGIHKPRFKMNERMMKVVHNTLAEADIILYFIDITSREEDPFILDLLRDKKCVFLLINKIDLLGKAKILGKIDTLKDVFYWKEIIPISALKGENIDLVEELIYNYLPESENYFYNEDQITIQSVEYYISELIREKILELTRDELPFASMVSLKEIKDRGKLIYIRTEIYVDSLSQKKIIIGKSGKKLKMIGESSRKEIEDYYDRKVYLDLFVKVVPNWRNSRTVLNESLD